MNIGIKDTKSWDYIEKVRALNSGRELYAHVLTFGCQQNEADSEKMRGMATEMGYFITEDAQKADLVLINTCAIREHAELKAFSVIGGFKAHKQLKPSFIMGVCGCMAAEEKVNAKIKKSFPYVSFTLEPNMLYRLPELIYKSLTEGKRSFLFGEDEGLIVEDISTVRKEKHRAWVSIMYGCNNFCSYCIVPYVRGRERSRNSIDVINECKSLISEGYREITLLGQNVNSYRSDMNFAELLEAIANIEGDFTVRFMTSHPKDVSDELIDVMGKYVGKIAPHFHLPLQSGSDRILTVMNRTYKTDRFMGIVEKLRKSVPGIALTSDIIVGFPGETEEDFQATLDILRRVEFDMVYSFIYSPREGTRAARMEDQIPYDIQSERMSRLLELQTDISKKKNLEYVGRVERVLVDSVSKRSTENTYAGRTLTNKRVHFVSDANCVGEFRYVKIDRAGAFDLFGQEIERK